MKSKIYLLEKFKTIIKNKRLNHFYIIEDENNEEQKKFMFELAYEFLKKENDTPLLKQQITNFSYPNFYYLDANQKNITKEDISDMKSYFAQTSLTEEKKVYVINGIENLSYKISNSLLFFLENPISEDHLGILLTRDCNLLLPTILSRAQVFSLKDENKYNMPQLPKNQEIDALDTAFIFLLKNNFPKEENSAYYSDFKQFFLFFLDTLPEKDIVAKLFFQSYDLNKIKYFLNDLLSLLMSFFLDLYYYKNNLNVIFPSYLFKKEFYDKLDLNKVLDILDVFIETEQQKIFLEPHFCFISLLIKLEKEIQI
ncbi:hypothetical protein ['Camptotheca acuminata' phytoplasma]|uniref:hypothetical protein n=1 Tax='Camptotheca acuminata' phytoplasma TaxID=3239192 RepID=UPI003519DF64